MPIYSFINPSDGYTFEARDTLVAGFAVCFLSQNCGAEQIDPPAENERTPMMFGWANWFEEKGVDDIDAWMETPGNAELVAAALDSFVIGDLPARREFEKQVAGMTPEQRIAYRTTRQDNERSSMNDFGTAAYKMAIGIRKKAEGWAAAKE